MPGKLTGIWMFLMAFSASTTLAYDGPAGVTLRAPVVIDKLAARHLRLGEMVVEVEVQDDLGTIRRNPRSFSPGRVSEHFISKD